MITKFQGEYRWLSNFYACRIPMKGKFQGIEFSCTETSYQMMKQDPSLIKNYIEWIKEFSNLSAKVAKKYGKTLTLRSNWNHIKLKVMENILRLKFSDLNPELKQKLIDTGNIHLQEGNHWKDKFWGVCLKTNTGENNLDKLLMRIRKELQKGL